MKERLNLAIHQLRSGKYEESKRELISLYKNDHLKLDQIAYYLAYIYEKEGDYDSALQYYQESPTEEARYKTIEILKNRVPIPNDEIRELIEGYIKKNISMHPQLYQTLGNIYETHVKKYIPALEAYRCAIKYGHVSAIMALINQEDAQIQENYQAMLASTVIDQGEKMYYMGIAHLYGYGLPKLKLKNVYQTQDPFHYPVLNEAYKLILEAAEIYHHPRAASMLANLRDLEMTRKDTYKTAKSVIAEVQGYSSTYSDISKLKRRHQHRYLEISLATKKTEVLKLKKQMKEHIQKLSKKNIATMVKPVTDKLKHLINFGDRESIFYLALIYDLLDERVLSEELMECAAIMKLPEALFKFANILLNQFHYNRDQAILKRAISMYEDAILYFKCDRSMVNLGILYENGTVTGTPEFQKAAKLYHMSAKIGNAAALNCLANLYLHGHGVDPNYCRAVLYYWRAIDMGDSDAKFNLNSLTETKWGLSILNQALEGFRQASMTSSHRRARRYILKLQILLGITQNWESDSIEFNRFQVKMSDIHFGMDENSQGMLIDGITRHVARCQGSKAYVLKFELPSQERSNDQHSWLSFQEETKVLMETNHPHIIPCKGWAADTENLYLLFHYAPYCLSQYIKTSRGEEDTRPSLLPIYKNDQKLFHLSSIVSHLEHIVLKGFMPHLFSSDHIFLHDLSSKNTYVKVNKEQLSQPLEEEESDDETPHPVQDAVEETTNLVSNILIGSVGYANTWKDLEVAKANDCYTPPEYLQSEYMDEHSIVYSIGMLIFELISHQKPYSEITNNYTIQSNILRGERPSLPQHVLEQQSSSLFLQRLIELMNECLAQKSQARPSFSTIQSFLVKTKDIMAESRSYKSLHPIFTRLKIDEKWLQAFTKENIVLDDLLEERISDIQLSKLFHGMVSQLEVLLQWLKIERKRKDSQQRK
mmetsp:Transcript_6782/g.9879  ORF Transcript_6782/g.9879 Transcript_6782/m.9879 type:complete len:936 (+) Transcript_6782:37-2844(+)